MIYMHISCMAVVYVLVLAYSNPCYFHTVCTCICTISTCNNAYLKNIPPLFSPHTKINPPYYIPLVEVIPSPWTAESVVTRTTELMKELGQSPVRAKKEVNGFIVNRLQYALIMEAWRLVEVCVYVWLAMRICVTVQFHEASAIISLHIIVPVYIP